MKKNWKRLVLGALLIAGVCNYSQAQDKNMLARVAYEEAEKAFEAGDISTAYDELKKVDEHLGKVTPKSQFLRVQVWNKYAERNGENLENAIKHCKNYLDLSKSFDLPEEKQIEVTRILVKLEKDKIAYDKTTKENAARKVKMDAFIDSIYKVFQYKTGMTEEEFVSRYPQEVKKMKRKQPKGSSNVFYETGATSSEGLDDVDFRNNKVIEFGYVVKYHASDPKGVRAYMDGLIDHIKSVFPAKDLNVSTDKKYIIITTSKVIPRSSITFQYFEHDKRNAIKSYVRLYFYTYDY